MIVTTKSRILLCIAIIAVSTKNSAAQEIFHGWSTRSSWSSIGNTWSHQGYYEFPPGVLRVPTAEELSHVTSEWIDIDIDKLGHYCTIHGRLMVQKELDQVKPVNWQQFFTVHLCKTPGLTPDWSEGVDSDSVHSTQASVNSDGTFSALIDLRECDKKSWRSREIQVGLSLAKQKLTSKGNLVVLTESSSPVLKQSIQMLTIPEAEKLPEILHLINQSIDWPDQSCSAVDVIRASNALRKLSSNDAIQALEDYYNLLMVKHDIFDAYTIYAIIQCTFEPADPNRSLPNPKYLKSLTEDDDVKFGRLWFRAPMEISEDIPYLLGRGVGMSGVPFNPWQDLMWLRSYGVCRDSPLRPADNPLESANRLINEPRFDTLSDFVRDDAKIQVQEQAYAMVSNLLPPVSNDSFGEPDVAASWNFLLDEARKINLFWDESTQAYSIKP